MSQLKLLSAEQIAQHNTAKDLWIVIEDQVWDMTDFAPQHPGGAASEASPSTAIASIIAELQKLSSNTLATMLPHPTVKSTPSRFSKKLSLPQNSLERWTRRISTPHGLSPLLKNRLKSSWDTQNRPYSLSYLVMTLNWLPTRPCRPRRGPSILLLQQIY